MNAVGLNENHPVCVKFVRFVQISSEMYVDTVGWPALVPLSADVSRNFLGRIPCPFYGSLEMPLYCLKLFGIRKGKARSNVRWVSPFRASYMLRNPGFQKVPNRYWEPSIRFLNWFSFSRVSLLVFAVRFTVFILFTFVI